MNTRSGSMFVHRRQEPPRPGIGGELQRGLPLDANQAGLDRSPQVESNPRRRRDQVWFRLMEPGKETAFTADGAFHEEAEPEQRLT